MSRFLVLFVCIIFRARAESGFIAAIQRFELTQISRDSISLNVYASVTAPRDVTIQSYSFRGIRINGLPVTMQPQAREVALKANKPMELGPVQMTILTRDVGSVEPLERIAREGRARVVGHVRLQIALNWLGRMALWSKDAQGVVAVDGVYPVSMPGGSLGRGVAGLILLAAGPLVDITAKERREIAGKNEFVQRFQSALAVVVASFNLRKGDGSRHLIEARSIGLLRGDNQILVPNEVLEPWRYDARLLAMIAQNEITVEPVQEVLVSFTPEGKDALTFALSRGEVSVSTKGCLEEKVLAPDERGKPHRTRVCVAASAKSIATLVVRSLPASIRPIDASARAVVMGKEQDAWVFRPLEQGGTSRWEAIAVKLIATTQGLRLTNPVDSDALGSPIVSAAGWHGLLMDQDMAIDASDVQ